MIQQKGMDEIALSGNGVTGSEFANFESECEAFRTERFSTSKHSIGARRTPETKRFSATLKGHGSQESHYADEMISMEMREKNVVEIERDPIAHHLALRSLAAIE